CKRVSYKQCDLISDSGELIEVTFALDSLTLNSGYYQLKIEIIENNLTTNHFLRFFSVKNLCVTSGGVPLLSYPAEIVLVNKEVKVCSDSTALMGG
ncbi:MAG: hypothetical protein K0U52_03005, partial [Gammaproteobacteria bacterium]|nr:hypothetical protein [Gammaproteobacteria bacterium]